MYLNPSDAVAEGVPTVALTPRRRLAFAALLRLVVLYSALIGVVATTYLLAPTPNKGDHFCGRTIRLGYHLTLPLNCDSAEFAQDAIKPERLLGPRDTRQDRPVFVLTAALLTRLLIASQVWRLVPAEAYARLAESIDQRQWPVQLQYLTCAYAAYILINFLLLLTALIMFHRLTIERLDPNLLVTAFASLLVVNDLVKAFFWTPHTQMFNLVVPLACVFMCSHILGRQLQSAGWFGGAGVLIGVLSLAYGSFAICIPLGVLALLITARRAKWCRDWRAIALRLAVLVAGFAVPLLSWVVTCKLIAGEYYNQEVSSYSQFVWVFEAGGGGWRTFVASLVSHVADFAGVLLRVTCFPLVLMGTIIVFALVTRMRLRPIFKERNLVLLAIGLTTITSLAFFYFMGFYRARLELDIAVPCLLAAAILQVALLEKPDARSLWPITASVVWMVAIGRLAYEVLKSGPWD